MISFFCANVRFSGCMGKCGCLAINTSEKPIYLLEKLTFQKLLGTFAIMDASFMSYNNTFIEHIVRQPVWDYDVEGCEEIEVVDDGFVEPGNYEDSCDVLTISLRYFVDNMRQLSMDDLRKGGIGYNAVRFFSFDQVLNGLAIDWVRKFTYAEEGSDLIGFVRDWNIPVYISKVPRRDVLTEITSGTRQVGGGFPEEYANIGEFFNSEHPEHKLRFYIE